MPAEHSVLTIDQQDLGHIAQRIRNRIGEIQKTARVTLRLAMDNGDDLNAAQKQVPQGQWQNWLREHCFLSIRTAQLHQQLADHRQEIEERLADIPELSLRAARKLISARKDDQEHGEGGDNQEAGEIVNPDHRSNDDHDKVEENGADGDRIIPFPAAAQSDAVKEPMKQPEKIAKDSQPKQATRKQARPKAPGKEPEKAPRPTILDLFNTTQVAEIGHQLQQLPFERFRRAMPGAWKVEIETRVAKNLERKGKRKSTEKSIATAATVTAAFRQLLAHELPDDIDSDQNRRVVHEILSAARAIKNALKEHGFTRHDCTIEIKENAAQKGAA
jgi:hypothetical protein